MYSGKTLKNLENALEDVDINNCKLVKDIIHTTIQEFAIFADTKGTIFSNISQDNGYLDIELMKKAGFRTGGANEDIGSVLIPYSQITKNLKKLISDVIFAKYKFNEDHFWKRTELYIPQGIKCEESPSLAEKYLLAEEDKEISYNIFPQNELENKQYAKALLNMYIDVMQTRNDSDFTLDDANALLVKLGLMDYRFLEEMREAINDFFKEEIKQKENIDNIKNVEFAK